MKRILSRSLVLSLCLLLSLPAVADAFFTRAPQYTITLSAENSNPGLVSTQMTATVTQKGVPAPGQDVAFTWAIKGDSPQPGPIVTANAIGQATYMLENSGFQPRVITVTAILQSDPKITASVDVQFELPPGFIAMSERPLNWSDAKAFCQQQGGRLPRINNSDSWSWDGWGEVTIDDFGARGAPWPSGLPGDRYWTGTEHAVSPGYADEPSVARGTRRLP